MSVPFYGKEFKFTQPDGTTISVKGWGDQNHAVFETLDGFTLVKDPVTGFYNYAQLSPDSDSYASTSVRAHTVDPKTLGIRSSLRISRDSARALAATQFGGLKRRWEMRREKKSLALRGIFVPGGPNLAPPTSGTLGKYVGLCVLVEFPDAPATIKRQEVDDFCNKPGYVGFENAGSVRDYFYDNSIKRLEYTNVVVPYYTAKYPRAYYTNPIIRQPTRTYELIKEVLCHLKREGFDASSLSADNDGYVYALNVFYAGECVNNWAEGLWPHSFRLNVPYELSPGRKILDYQITNMGSELSLGTFCHENGHMVCDFPDLYDYGYESQGVGVYCLMCAGSNISPKNPTQICAYLKYKAGWADCVVPLTNGMAAEAHAKGNRFYKYQLNAAEYFLVEARNRVGRDGSLPCSGLAIWHVDELGSNNSEQMSPTQHYECSLEQADGRCDLENGQNYGDEGDLFGAAGRLVFSDTSSPSSKWWNGKDSGLRITNIGAPGQQIAFSVG